MTLRSDCLGWPVGAGCDGVVHDHLGGASRGPLTFVPPEHQRAGNVDARIGAGDDADQEGEGEIVDDAASKQIERQRRQKHRSRSNDRAA